MPLARIPIALAFLLALVGWAAAQTALPSPLAPAKPAETAATPSTPAAPALSAEDAARALATVIADETARKRLLEDLQRLSAGGGAPSATSAAPTGTAGTVGLERPAAAPTETAPADTSLARELGEYTQEIGRDAVAVLLKIWRGLSNLGHLFDGSAEVDWVRLHDQLISVGQLVLVAFGVFYAGRWVARWPLGLMQRAAEGAPPWRRALFVLLATLLDVLALVLSSLSALSFLLIVSPQNRIDVVESLFLNAFVLIEAVKIGLRALFQARRPSLRLVPLTDATAAFWSFALARLTGFLGYGVMLVFPLVNASIGFAVGLGVRLAIVIAAAATTVVLVHVRRDPLRTELVEATHRLRSGAAALVLATLAHTWHLLVSAYVVVAFLIWVTRPFDAIRYMAVSTILSLVVLGLGGLAISLLNRGIDDGVRLPSELKRALPLLENRLNLLVPAFLRTIRLVVLAALVAGVLQAWDVVDLLGWIESESGSDMVGRIVSALVVIGVAMAAWIVATSWIEFRLSPASGRVSTARARTLLSLFRNAFTIFLVLIAAMLALSQLGVDIAPLIAGAGVVGLAVGFGSQKLVQDIITGAFIQFENAMNEGDVVTVAGISGVVDRLTIRSVGIRDVDGVYHVIPFSSVDSVSNAMRGFAFHVADVTVGYREDIDTVKRLMNVAFERLMAGPNGAAILEPLEMNGITQFIENAVVVRGRIKTLPGQQWAVGRAYNEALKHVFDENGIELPFARTAVLLDAHSGRPEARSAAPAETSADEPGAAAPPSRRRRRPAETIDVPDSPNRRREHGRHDDDGDDDDGEER
ncbi:mechanosensitive ion channel domain-containing protein [Oharaeibacter diazotrophicus]|uniref:Small conductance mechanosensitive channel n=2 Tax=Oharaeibacter diazotrophicus TaxID=1920512 RepID=A0A4R6RBZ4_9HYPH|nr:mechanosensitive ion channel domain-containing protein [Oharaeibacter diazotrophicus]TDP83599.1 small conductance mechanosensitive channel [Oharaeibacter diazotrophicus]BBE72432.1 moderate conductance mechanosensitive channel YbiO precursor [Pleomorphomonas sp. SM30]GLS79202.1 hypothetical protein GCM10007904_45390 [Oharaeibacter diazotrophicus]